MRKLTDFIVTKRYFILMFFIIMAIISFVASKNVNLNYEMAEYMPSDSETKIGMDIMENEFETENSSFNLMFNGISDNEKKEILNYLENVENVSSVDYDETEDYNKDGYVLYIINVDAEDKSEVSKNVFNEITTHFKNYEIYTSGDISNINSPVVPTYILILAVGCAVVILIIMCDSYIEPFLFLFAILIAVFLNKGTNLIFGTISNVTSSIFAILQLALSMDYSIMLMNRYNQEKAKESNKEIAMKNALYDAFKSISSSSVTTIVGLLALVFMSFTIGKDLGFVLAKGVLFSLISIFFVLPGLIIMFDKLLIKTKKNKFNLRLDKLGKFSYKFRPFSLITFIAIFVFSFVMKGNLLIQYTQSENDLISKIFTPNNQIAVIYKNSEEGKIREYLSKIEDDTNVKEVLAYGNTIDQKLSTDGLKQKLDDLGADVDIDTDLLKILYYNYYNQAEDNTITFDEFVNFIENDVYKQEKINDKIDDDVKDNINTLKKFTSSNEMNKQRTSAEIANILDISESDVNDLFIYYNSINNDLKLTIPEFIAFMNNDVLTNTKYSENIDQDMRENISTISKFTSMDTLQTKMSSEQMAELFGIESSKMNDLYNYYILVGDINYKMTIAEFSNFVLNDVQNSQYASSISSETLESIKMLNTFSNVGMITTQMNSTDLSNLFGIDESVIKKLLFLKYRNIDDASTLSISEFINYVVYLKNNTNYLNNVDLEQIEKLSFFAKNDDNINNTKLNKAMLSEIFDSISVNFVEIIYEISGFEEDYCLTPNEFIDYSVEILSQSTDGEDSQDGGVFSVDDDTLNKLKLLKLIINDTISDEKTKYTSTKLSNLLGVDKQNMSLLYALINMFQGNTNAWTSSPNELVNLILSNIENPEFSGTIDDNTIQKLNLVNNIMNSSINGYEYSYSELGLMLGIDEENLKNVYALYLMENSNLKLMPDEFVNFVLDHKNDSILEQNLSSDQIENLQLLQKIMNSVKSNTYYSSSELRDLLDIDKENLDLLYGLYISNHINTNQTFSLREFVQFILNDVITNNKYSDNFDDKNVKELKTLNGIMNSVLNNTKYTKNEIFSILTVFSDSLDQEMIDLLFVYYGSTNEFDENWTMTVEEFVNFLNNNILNDSRFDDFIDDDMRQNISDSKNTIQDAKKLLLGNNYSRLVINTKYLSESEDTFNFIKGLKEMLGNNIDEYYVIGNSPMAYEMSQSFNDELNFITIITMVSIFIVVAITFKSIVLPVILVFTIQCAVYLTMGILSISGGNCYFIALLIVQSILMGATIDYAILYSSYYLEFREKMNIKESIINAYNHSIHTILVSSSILVIVTLIVGYFSTSVITAKICTTISSGTLCSTLLILLLLPSVIALCDKFVVKKKVK